MIPLHPACQCATCAPLDMNNMRMIVCVECGNKRCPAATDCRLACTKSNLPGQWGSSYGERVGTAAELAARAALAVRAAPNSPHADAIRRACSAWSGQWPEQLTSGIMFFDGERITRAEFDAETLRLPPRGPALQLDDNGDLC